MMILMILMILIDSDWFWLILIDSDWFWSILIDSDWFWLILIDSDSDEDDDELCYMSVARTVVQCWNVLSWLNTIFITCVTAEADDAKNLFSVLDTIFITFVIAEAWEAEDANNLRVWSRLMMPKTCFLCWTRYSLHLWLRRPERLMTFVTASAHRHHRHR